MANAGRTRNRRSANNRAGVYVDGNTVRRVQALPKGRPERKAKVRPARRKVSRKTQQNRAKAQGMNMGFVIFLTLICGAILFTGVRFLQMKSEITAKAKVVTNLETELSELKADNDAYYSQVTASVNLDAIKKKAITELGMKYPSEEQIEYYETQRSSYVRQYQDVPDAE
ncbi:MAG TPA: hypothetical protein IAA45_13005 [Candidatus Blautia gallistercoris]|uniref:Cell division protein FtsL n=1 Tax=Candidatus Blautia gallistercoris TaxID=2838490 RepID=A0A9D2B4B1_9FIRM|nr:hypothetical protein [Candidatus Blautia gallistercoris]